MRELITDMNKLRGFNYILEGDFSALIKQKFEQHKAARRAALKPANKKPSSFAASVSTVTQRRKNVRAHHSQPHRRLVMHALVIRALCQMTSVSSFLCLF